MVFGYTFHPHDAVTFLTLLLLESVLSFDNAAVLAAMVMKLPAPERRKALLYGLVGAYVFRILTILGVVWVIRYPIIKALGGAYLVYLMAKHLLDRDEEQGAPPFLERLGFSSFWGVVIAVEVADLAFAFDQILAAVALTPNLVIIIAASLVSILLLRVAASYMTHLIAWFPPLETFAYLAVGFVGLKLIVVELMHHLGYPAFDVPRTVSVGFTLALLVVPVVVRFVWGRLDPERFA